MLGGSAARQGRRAVLALAAALITGCIVPIYTWDTHTIVDAAGVGRMSRRCRTSRWRRSAW